MAPDDSLNSPSWNDLWASKRRSSWREADIKFQDNTPTRVESGADLRAHLLIEFFHVTEAIGRNISHDENGSVVRHVHEDSGRDGFFNRPNRRERESDEEDYQSR